jgi:hypothetical protein
MMRGRAFGTLSEDALDAILEEMDTVWASMSEADCTVADAEAAAIAASAAPEELGLVDCDVEPGTGGRPRRAA